ncbi:MAG: YHS domain-containing (seleno)protein [Pseudomonadota bacterium]
MRNFLKTTTIATAIALGSISTLGAISAFAADEVSVTADAQAANLAIQGYDVVSYRSGAPVEGAARFATDYEGATYRFASQDNLDAFTADPARFAPAYGGFCAYGVAKGKKFDADPLAYTVKNDRLYLNLNKRIQKKWLKKQEKYIGQAEINWPEIEHVSASEL